MPDSESNLNFETPLLRNMGFLKVFGILVLGVILIGWGIYQDFDFRIISLGLGMCTLSLMLRILERRKAEEY